MKKLLLILFCLPMIGFGQEWRTSNDAWESIIEELTSRSGGENLIPLPSTYIENYPDHSDYLRSETARLQKKEKKFYEGISNFNCINTCDVTWQGNELDGVCYYKHNMEVVNGCIEVKSEVNGANSWDPSKIYIYAKLIIKSGRLSKVMLWHPNGQLQLKTKSSAEIFTKNDFNEDSANCYTENGYPTNCSFFGLVILRVLLQSDPYNPCK